MRNSDLTLFPAWGKVNPQANQRVRIFQLIKQSSAQSYKICRYKHTLIVLQNLKLSLNPKNICKR